MLQSNQFKFFDVFSYIFLCLTVLFVPVFMDKNLVNMYIIPKEYVFIGLTLLSLLFFAAKIVITKKLDYRRTVLDWPLLLILLVGLVSAIFSRGIYDSFLGRSEYFVINFLFLFFIVLFYFLAVNILHNTKRWQLVVDLLVTVGGLSALTFVLKMIFKLDLLNYLFGPVWNTVDKLNSSFGLWLVVTFVLAAGQLLKKNLSINRSLSCFFVAIISFASLVLMSFSILWWILLVGLVLLLLLGVSNIKESRLGWISVLFATLIAVVIFIAFGTPQAVQSPLPSEVALGFKPSWNITYSTVFSGVKNFVIGSGLGSFGVDFSRFRPVDFNYDSLAWSLRFNQPFSTFLALLSEGGVILIILVGFMIALVLGHIFQVWYKSRGSSIPYSSFSAVTSNDLSFDVFLIAIVWVVLTASGFMLFFGPVLWWLWALCLVLLIVGLSFFQSGIVDEKIWEVEDTPQFNLAFSFTLIIVIAAVVILGVWGARLYMADRDYSLALRSTDLKIAEKYLLSAIDKRSTSDIYNAALAQVYLSQAVQASQKPKPDIQEVSTLVAKAVNSAKLASGISPSSVAIWENLATMYENASVIVPDARDWAVKSLLEAKSLETSNPVLWWRLGNSYSLSAKWEDAIKSYEEAIRLKSDYLGSYVGLANAYEQKGEVDKAVESYRNIMSSAASNPEALFNFGRLLYNRNKTTDRADAEKIWLETIRIQPNYSNALYSLGLLYETRGDKTKALEYYYKVKELNPDNADIAAKIRSLVGAMNVQVQSVVPANPVPKKSP